MYVWDSRAAPEAVIPSATTDRVRKFVVDSGPVQPASWRFHERDVASDFKKAFGEAPGRLTSIALMTGSDSAAEIARAYYGEVRLLSPDGAAQ